MAEVKLEAIKLADSPIYTKTTALQLVYFPIYPVNNDKVNYTLTGYTRSDIDAYDALYGIRYKYLQGINSDGQYTQAYITTWDDTFIYLYIWSNQRPATSSILKLVVVRPTDYIQGTVETLQVDSLLKSDTLTITQQFESLRKMDLRVSTASFELVESDALNEFMGKYWTADRYPSIPNSTANGDFHVIGVHITEGVTGMFWGYTKPENITYDPESGVYTIDCFDWVKFILDTKGQNMLPDYQTIDLPTFLADNMFLFNDLNVRVGSINQNWVALDYNRILETNSDGNTVLVSVENLMTVEDLIIEAMKHYGAFMYYDGNKDLNFVNRCDYTPIIQDVSTSTIANSLSKVYTIRDFDSLLLNVSGTWLGENGVSGTYNGWALVWYDNDQMQSIPVDANLYDIPKDRKYLDLRQRIPYEVFTYRLFYPREREEVAADYKDLLFNSESYNLKIYSIYRNLNDQIQLFDDIYIVRSVEIDYEQNISTLLVEKKIGN